jgi:hypothetical protein
MKKLLFVTFYLIIPGFFFAQDNVSWDQQIAYFTNQCQYCKKQDISSSVLEIKNVSNIKLLDCVYMSILNEREMYNSSSQLKYGICTSMLNKTDHCIVSVITSKTSIEKRSSNCGGYTLDLSHKNYEDFSANNHQFRIWFKGEDVQKFKQYRLNLESNQQKDYKSGFDNLEKVILNKDFEKAALLYQDLANGKFGNNEFLRRKKEIIQSGLNNSTTKVAALNSGEINRIILSNRDSFKELFKDKAESIEIIFDQKGNGFINGSPSKIINVNPVVLKEVGNFKVYCKSKGLFLFSLEQIQNPNKTYNDIWVSPDIKICKIGNKYFKKSLFSASLLRNEISVVNNNQVPNGKYWKVRHELKLYKVNGTEINQEELLVKDSEHRLSPRVGMKMARATGSLAIITWITFRFMEYSSVK